MPHAVTHLEAAIDGTRLPFGEVVSMHANRPVWVRYDLDRVRQSVSPDQFAQRKSSLWRYRELLPLPWDEQPVTLGEGMTPLLTCPRLGALFGLNHLRIKDESQMPTGSFKSRGMTVAVSMAKWLGIKRIALPTAGNAGGAAAAYAARAGMECYVFMPDDTPIVNQFEPSLYGAKTFRVDGLINDCGAIVREGIERMGWFDIATLKEPYRLEGKKTLGLELAEQLDWKLPDVILFPTGGGTGLIAMWKAFKELRELGWLKSATMPRMIACQSNGCAPIVEAFQNQERHAAPFPNAHTIASGVRVPVAVGDFMAIDTLHESGGKAVAANEDRLAEWMRRASQAEGINICPETAVCFDVLEQLVEAKDIQADENVVVFNTGSATKYLEVLKLELPRINRKSIDWDAIANEPKA